MSYAVAAISNGSVAEQLFGSGSVLALSTHLQDCNDDDEKPIGGEKYPGLLDGATVAKERDDEDEGPSSDEDVRALLDHRGLSQILLEESNQ